MNTRIQAVVRTTSLLSALPSFFVVLLLSLLSHSCASLETRLAEAEQEGRLGEAFWLSVEYYDDNIDDADDLPAARAAVERVGNAYLNHLIHSAEQAVSNDYFANAISYLYQHPKHSAVAVIQAADIRGISLAKKTVPDLMHNGVYAALDSYYQRGIDIFNTGNWSSAIAHFTKMQGLKDADWYIAESQRELQYAYALSEFNAKRYRSAYAEFNKLDSKYKDVADMRVQCIKLGKVVVAVFGFSHDRGNAIQKRITTKLLQDVFIEVINADNMEKFSRVSPGTTRNISVDFIINGSTTLYISPVRYRTLRAEHEAWVVADTYRVVDTTQKGPRYVRDAYPLGFVQQELALDGTIDIHYEIAEASGFTTAFSDDIHAHSEDKTTQWDYSGNYSPDRFTVRNPALDTLSGKSSWHPSYKDCRFQENFTEQKPLISPPAMAEALINTGAEKAANAVLQAIRRLEEQELLSTR